MGQDERISRASHRCRTRPQGVLPCAGFNGEQFCSGYGTVRPVRRCPRSDFCLTRPRARHHPFHPGPSSSSSSSHWWHCVAIATNQNSSWSSKTATDKPAAARFGGLSLEDETDPLVSSLSRPAMPGRLAQTTALPLATKEQLQFARPFKNSQRGDDD